MNTNTMSVQTKLAYLQSENDRLAAEVESLRRKLASQERVNRRLVAMIQSED